MQLCTTHRRAYTQHAVAITQFWLHAVALTQLYTICRCSLVGSLVRKYQTVHAEICTPARKHGWKINVHWNTYFQRRRVVRSDVCTTVCCMLAQQRVVQSCISAKACWIKLSKMSEDNRVFVILHEFINNILDTEIFVIKFLSNIEWFNMIFPK